MGKIVNTCGFAILFLMCRLVAVESAKGENYTKYVNEVINSFSKEMRKRFGLICIGDGGSMPYDVQEITVIFQARQRATIEVARELEIRATERLVEIINAHSKIRPYLREYPFPPGRIEIRISFVDKKGRRYQDGSVALAFQAKDRLFYCERGGETGGLKDLFDEPYEEARRKVYEQTNATTAGQPPNRPMGL
jgi:hypothetical protein